MAQENFQLSKESNSKNTFMILQKIIGVFLVIGGICIIVAGLYSGFQTFTGRAEPPELFEAPVAEEHTTNSAKTPQEQQLEDLFSKQSQSFIPPEFLPKMLNLSSWGVFLGIVMLAGGQVAGIGIKLFRTT